MKSRTTLYLLCRVKTPARTAALLAAVLADARPTVHTLGRRLHSVVVGRQVVALVKNDELRSPEPIDHLTLDIPGLELARVALRLASEQVEFAYGPGHDSLYFADFDNHVFQLPERRRGSRADVY